MTFTKNSQAWQRVWRSSLRSKSRRSMDPRYLMILTFLPYRSLWLTITSERNNSMLRKYCTLTPSSDSYSKNVRCWKPISYLNDSSSLPSGPRQRRLAKNKEPWVTNWRRWKYCIWWERAREPKPLITANSKCQYTQTSERRKSGS